ncbi:outer membrane protein [Geomonas sp. Red276]
MKKLIIACLAATLSLTAATAGAESISGRVGLTGRVGFQVPADNESDFFHNSTDTGIVGGGGIIYGIDSRFAVEAEVTRSGFGSETGDFGVTDVSFGGQYRFANLDRRFVPYLGAGLDILLSDYYPYGGGTRDVDTTVGVHLSGGLDYFIQRQLAFTAELKGVLAPDTDINDRFGTHVGNFDPSSFSGTFGLRYFFN